MVSSESDYIVIRASAQLPRDFRIGDLEGKWFNRSARPIPEWFVGGAVAVPTGTFEVRADGVVAEVFEIRP